MFYNQKIKLEKKEGCSLSQAFDKIKEKDFDILLTVGAGNIDTLYDPIMNWLGSNWTQSALRNIEKHWKKTSFTKAQPKVVQ